MCVCCWPRLPLPTTGVAVGSRVATWRRSRRRRRRWQEETLVTEGLRQIGETPVPPLADLAGVGVGRVYVVLARLEGSGRVVSRWADTAPPRRRLYRLAEVCRG